MDNMKTVLVSKSSEANRLLIKIAGDYIAEEVIRSEGAREMHLNKDEVIFDLGATALGEINNDIVALIAVLSFHPAFPEEAFVLQFDFPVSDNVQKALHRPNILPLVTISSPRQGEPFKPVRDMVISYGGGFDSLAAHLLFPEAPLVHESPLGDYSDIVNDIVPDLSDQAWVVKDNMRTLFSIWGLPLWVSVFASSLLFSPRYIISGSEMTGTYLNGGKAYFPRHRNRWYEVFRAIGVDVLPTSFLSEIGNARVVKAHGRIEDAAYCTFIRMKDCGKCSKCLRRRAIRAMLDENEQSLLDDFTRSDGIDDFLKVRPLYYGDVFIHAVGSNSRPSWLKENLSGLIDANASLDFHEHYYLEVFEHFSYPEHLAERAKEGLHAIGMMPFRSEDIDAFQNFKQNSES